MYSYSFDICFKDSYSPYITIYLDAKDKLSPYENIMIQVHDEKQKEWSTSIEASCMKDEPYSGKFFFNWLSRQSLYDYGEGRIILSCFSPYELYTVLLKAADIYDVFVDTDEPADIDDPGSSFKDMYKNLPPDVVF